MMQNFKVFIGAHGTAAVVFFAANDVDFAYIERIGGTDDGTNVKVMFDVLDGDFEAGAFFTKLQKGMI